MFNLRPNTLPRFWKKGKKCAPLGRGVVLLERQPVETGEIEDVRRRSAVQSAADVHGDSLHSGHLTNGMLKPCLTSLWT